MSTSLCSLNFFDSTSVLYIAVLYKKVLRVRAGWVMTGLSIPPEFFFSQKDTSGDFLDTPGPKKTHLGHFSGFSGV